MKYSEFLQFQEILEKNGISTEELRKNPKLYEAGLLGKVGAGLWNLAKIGMKKAVSAGLTNSHKEKLNAKAEEIKTWVTEEIKKGQSDSGHILAKTFEDRKKALAQKKPDQQILRDANKAISEYIHNNVGRQVKKVEKKINDNKMLTDDDKETMTDYWEDLRIQIELGVSASLRELKILTDDSFETVLSRLNKNANIASRSQAKNPKSTGQNLPKIGKEYRINIGAVPTRVKITKIDKKFIYFTQLENGTGNGQQDIKYANEFKPVKT